VTDQLVLVLIVFGFVVAQTVWYIVWPIRFHGRLLAHATRLEALEAELRRLRPPAPPSSIADVLATRTRPRPPQREEGMAVAATAVAAAPHPRAQLEDEHLGMLLANELRLVTAQVNGVACVFCARMASHLAAGELLLPIALWAGVRLVACSPDCGDARAFWRGEEEKG
jgi:hypothetical protein